MQLVEPVPTVKVGHDAPSFVLYSHWQVGAGYPAIIALKVAVVPTRTVVLLGGVVIEGTASCTKVTLLLVAPCAVVPPRLLLAIT